MTTISIRDTKLFVEVAGRGYPLVLMHGGPGADHWTMVPFRRLADQFTLVFYDHRCNGRSNTVPVETMTWDNLTADADALRERLGFERWAVLGHSFGGHVALEYALRYPHRVSHLVLLDTAADGSWAPENAPKLLAQHGISPEKVELVRRWFNGEFAAKEMSSIFMEIGDVYSYKPSILQLVHGALAGAWRTKMRGETFIFASHHLCKGWSVKDRLAEISAPTLVLAGRHDFVFPPECQAELAAAIPESRLQFVERAGHNPHWEQTSEVMDVVGSFISGQRSVGRPPVAPAAS
jgi:proline-specific peptidase